MKAPEMKKTPTALKWLAEKRARIAGELQSADQVSQYLREDIEELHQQTAVIAEFLAAAEQKQERLRGELAALDQVVVLYDAGLRPDSIAPINGWQGNYGTRGALRAFLVETLKGRAPEFVTTQELEMLTISKFSLVFEHREVRLHWYKGSFRGTLKLLASQQLIERGHGKVNYLQEMGRWRWKQEVAPTLKELREAAGGVATPPYEPT